MASFRQDNQSSHSETRDLSSASCVLSTSENVSSNASPQKRAITHQASEHRMGGVSESMTAIKTLDNSNDDDFDDDNDDDDQDTTDDDDDDDDEIPEEISLYDSSPTANLPNKLKTSSSSPLFVVNNKSMNDMAGAARIADQFRLYKPGSVTGAGYYDYCYGQQLASDNLF